MGEQQQVQVQVQQPPHLKCPRCDSSNTKFCYYNNYSLSQPRHLCKSCKRYWTRGGTLRNVPVGGKCKKNKICRDTKQSSTSSSISISSSSSSASMAILAPVKPSTITTVQSSLSLPSSSTARTHINNPLFSKRDIGKDLSSFPQFCLDGDELGFLTSQNLPHNLKPAAGGDDTNVVAISNQVFSGYPLFGINSSTTSTTATATATATASTSSTLMASTIIASNLEQQNLVIFNGFKESAAPQPRTQTPYGFLDLDDVQMTRNIDEDFRLAKYAKLTEGHWTNHQNYVEEMKFSSDPHPPFMWNSSAAWLDSSNMGSSVPSLI